MMKMELISTLSWFLMITFLIFMTKNFKSHPILFLILIIIYSTLLSMNMSIWKKNFVYSILIFLIMISGLLIIFLYFSSLISNEQMNLNMNKILLTTIIMNFMLLLLNIYVNKLFTNNLIYLTKESNSIMMINESLFTNIRSIYLYPFNNITIMCMMYLLLMLFTIIKMASMKSKPLRKIMN